jgi:hypothetical protein
MSKTDEFFFLVRQTVGVTALERIKGSSASERHIINNPVAQDAGS